ncbi:uncharacterized protein LOC124430365 [Vespa crabro]|uniref:uncharacterized protein LOC124430365 n=1 Tax=Vespa crabro TaxID=7445 RepID=UPI001F01AF4F|nr:uncharacterized protein LOC124430365 [Vespa crabro]
MEQDGKTYIPLNKSFLKNNISGNEGSCLNVVTPYVSHSNSSVSRINEYFTKLSINSNITKQKLEISGNDKYLAGTIRSIITSMGLVLIQPSMSNLLYLDTPLFVYNPNSQNQSFTNYVYLGKIDDIFGSVKEPMYSVSSLLEEISILNVGDQVYFLLNDPNTKFMSVEHKLNNTFNIIKHKCNE